MKKKKKQHTQRGCAASDYFQLLKEVARNHKQGRGGKKESIEATDFPFQRNRISNDPFGKS